MKLRMLLPLLALSTNACMFLKSGPSPWLVGNDHFRHKEYAAAETELAKVAPGDPYYQPALETRARAALELGDANRALDLMKKAEAVNPTTFHKDKNLFYDQIYSAYLTKTSIQRADGAMEIVGGDGVAIVLSTIDTLDAYDVASGRPLWSADLKNGRDDRGGHPIWAAGTVVAVKGRVSNMELVAFDAKTGTRTWSVPLGHQSYDIVPASDGKRAYFAHATLGKHDAVGHSLDAVDLGTGAPAWSLPLDGRSSRMATADGKIFVRTEHGTVYAVDAERGTLAWSVNVPGKFEADDRLVAGNGMVYFVTQDGSTIALDAVTPSFPQPLDRIQWRSKGHDGLLISWPSLLGELVIVPHRRDVEAFDAHTGALKWTANLAFDVVQTSRMPVTTSAADGQVVIGWDNRVAGIGEDGGVRWVYAAADGATPLVAGDVVLVGTGRGTNKPQAVVAVVAKPPIAY